MELLNVKDLTLSFCENGERQQVVEHVSFGVQQGEILGIVGESGSGKSMVVHCIMGLRKRDQVIDSGSVTFDGKELFSLTAEEMRGLQGQDMSIVFQEPMTTLNPVMKIGPQVEESLFIHQKELSAAERKARAIRAMKDVELPNAEELYNSYPHELSGGMRQRVMIASAIICNPKLLICDEPTTALDVTIQAQILDLINELKEKLGTSVMMITHDLGVIAEVADDVMVMYAGKVVEYGSADDIFESPKHPYTVGLMNCIPKLTDEDHTHLAVIKGMVPSFDQMPKGCAFCPRCAEARDICRERMPELTEVDGQKVRCFKYSKEWEDAR